MTERSGLVSELIQHRIGETLYRLLALVLGLYLAGRALPERISVPLVLVFLVIDEVMLWAGELTEHTVTAAVITGAMTVLVVLALREPRRLELPAAFLVFLLFRVLQRSALLRRAVLISLIAALAMVPPAELPRPAAAAAVVLVLMELESVFHRGEKMRYYLLFVLLEIAVWAMPGEQQRFDWSFIYRIGDRMAGVAESFMMNAEYLFSEMGITGQYAGGYSGLGRVGGGINGEGRIEVLLDRRPGKERLYLTGSVFRDLKSSGWSGRVRSDDIPDGWYLDFLNALVQQDVTVEEAACFAQMKDNTVTFGYLRTRDLLHPGSMVLLDGAGGDLTDDRASFLLSSSKGRKYRYSFKYIAFDYANPYLVRVLRTAPDFAFGYADYETLKNYSRSLFPSFRFTEEIPEEDYDKHIRARSAEVPSGAGKDRRESVPEEVRALAEEVTADAETVFDQCLAVETYLRQYTYDPTADFSGEEDFVRTFLFEEKRGYCVHYASAMAELLWALDIPARVAEGYDAGSGRLDEDRAKLILRGSAAHAWPEAYIDGYGWVAFEPCAVKFRTGSESLAWGYLVKEADETLEGVPAGGPEGYTPASAEEASFLPEPVPEPEPEAPSVMEVLLPYLRTGGIIFAAVLLASVLLVTAAVLLKVLRYRRADNPGRLSMLMEDIRKLIKYLAPEEDWTNRPLAFYEEVLARLNGKADRRTAKAVFEAYRRSRFAGRPPGDRVISQARILRGQLMEQMSTVRSLLCLWGKL